MSSVKDSHQPKPAHTTPAPAAPAPTAAPPAASKPAPTPTAAVTPSITQTPAKPAANPPAPKPTTPTAPPSGTTIPAPSDKNQQTVPPPTKDSGPSASASGLLSGMMDAFKPEADSGTKSSKSGSKKAGSEAVKIAAKSSDSAAAAATLHQASTNGDLDKFTSSVAKNLPPDSGPLNGNRPPSGVPGDSKNIAYLSQALNTANDPNLTHAVAKDLVSETKRVQVNALSFQLSKSVKEGRGADLAIGIVQELQAAGRTKEAQTVLDGIGKGLGGLQGSVEKSAEKGGQARGRLGALAVQFGPLASSPEQLEKAQEAYLASGKDGKIIQEQNRLAGSYADTLKDVQALKGLEKDGFSLKSLKNGEEKLATAFPSFAASDPGKQILAQDLASFKGDQTKPGTNVLYEVLKDDVSSKLDDHTKKAIGQSLQSTITASSLAAVNDPEARGQLEHQLDGLKSLTDKQGTAFLGANANQVTRFANALSSSVSLASQGLLHLGDKALSVAGGPAANQDPSAVKGERATLGALGKYLKDEDFNGLSNTAIGLRFALGSASLFNSLAAGAPKDEVQALQTFNSALSAGGDLAKLKPAQSVLSKIFDISPTSIETFGKASGAFSVAGGLLDLVRYGTSDNKLEKLPGAAAAVGSIIQGTGSLAGWAVSSGVSTSSLATGLATFAPGVGAGVVVAGLLAQHQFDSVRKSNKLETEATEAYIRQIVPRPSGVSADDYDKSIHHLRNADSEGVLAGIVFQRTASNQGVSAAEFARKLVSQKPDEVEHAIEIAHGLVGSKTQSADAIPQRHFNDQYVGQRVQKADYGPNVLLDPKFSGQKVAGLHVRDLEKRDLLENLPYPSGPSFGVVTPQSIDGYQAYLQRFLPGLA